MVAPVPAPGRRSAPAPVTPGQRLQRGLDLVLVVIGAVALLGLLLGISADSRARVRAAALAPQAPPVDVAETERDGQLRVLVLGSDKEPLPSAGLRLFWEQQRRYFDAGRAQSDEAGRASLERVPRGRVWLLAEAPGHARASTQLIIEGGTREVTLELRRATTLQVKVTD